MDVASQGEDKEGVDIQKAGFKYSRQYVHIYSGNILQEVGDGGSAKYTDACSLCEVIREGLHKHGDCSGGWAILIPLHPL